MAGRVFGGLWKGFGGFLGLPGSSGPWHYGAQAPFAGHSTIIPPTLLGRETLQHLVRGGPERAEEGEDEEEEEEEAEERENERGARGSSPSVPEIK